MEKGRNLLAGFAPADQFILIGFQAVSIAIDQILRLFRPCGCITDDLYIVFDFYDPV
jgi:hypothetical protein